MEVIKTEQCPSVSGKSTLTYNIGRTDKSETQLRIFSNTGAGFFSDEWVPLKSIEEAIGKGGHFTSTALKPIIKGKFINTAAFMLAVLLHEGFVKKSTAEKRSYVWAGSKTVPKPKASAKKMTLP